MIPAPLPFETDLHELEVELAQLESNPESGLDPDVLRSRRRELSAMRRERFANLTPWETVLVARHRDRPQTLDYVDMLFEDFVELHGDRAFGDDRAIRTGFARLDGQKVMLVGHQKGKTLEERQQCYYGCAHPEGYRKALTKMQLAAKYRVPVVCLIDTPGAFPGIGAEERGQSQLIARSIFEMTTLKVPVVCVVIGEGGSGGALGIGIGDTVAILQHAYYSVISPEGCAGILWRVATEETRTQAAAALRLRASDLLRAKVVDDVVPEPIGGAHRSPRAMAKTLGAYLTRVLRDLTRLPSETLLQRRYQKFREMGLWNEISLGS